MAIKIEEIEICKMCGDIIHTEKDEYYVRRNTMTLDDALSRGIVCVNCVDIVFIHIDETEFYPDHISPDELKKIERTIAIIRAKRGVVNKC